MHQKDEDFKQHSPSPVARHLLKQLLGKHACTDEALAAVAGELRDARHLANRHPLPIQPVSDGPGHSRLALYRIKPRV